MKARVLICRATPIAPDPRVDKIARSLQRGGYQVTTLGWDMTGEFALDETVEGVRRRRCRVVVKPARGLRNIPNQLRWQAALGMWLLRHRREIDVVHACDFDTVLPALGWARLFGKKVVYDIFDFYADMLRSTPEPVRRWVRALDLRLIGAADAVILADDSRTEQIAGSQPKRCEVLYNVLEDARLQLDGAHYQPARRERLHIAYVGNLLVERGLLVLLDVLGKHPEWSLDLAGFGPDEALIVERAHTLANVTWHGRVPYARTLQITQAADLLLATYDPSILNNRYSSPNKVFEAMMLGKPIIVARGSQVDRLVEREGCGVAVDYGQAAALEQALTELDRDPALRARLGQNARRAFEQTYNWPAMETRLIELYHQVLAPCESH